MEIKDRNSCMEAFTRLQVELEMDKDNRADSCPYWVYERGYRAAVQELLEIAETGVQLKKFVSPKLQSLAERLISGTDCV
jgi:hypothetical protein